VLPEGIVPKVDMGLVTAVGPTHKHPGVHDDFDQCYLIFRGTGAIHLDGRRVRIDRPGIVVIPHGIEHSMEVDAGQTMQYVYVNHKVGD
jgi:mannose-6-phosphate isomerase-like protein (cupin superfamily)